MRIRIVTTILFVLTISIPLAAQSPVEERLARIEARIDTLLSYHRGIAAGGPYEDVLRDDDNLRWGIRGHTGTVLDKDFFVVNHHDNWKISYWVA